MALALKLGENHTPPERLDVTATVVLDAVDGIPTITTSRLKVRAQVVGLDAHAFAAVVDQAAALCPVSRLFAGAEISVDAQLAQTDTLRHAR
jgi:lipoyl-dependent peroxiredoxin